jgi:hypothetical protein
MRLSFRLCVLAFLLGLSFAATRHDAVQAAPKPTNPTAIVTFDDTGTYDFYGDGAPYENGVDNIVAKFHNSGDLTLHLLDSIRKFYGKYCEPTNPPTPCTPPPNSLSGGSYSFLDGWFLNIHDIRNMGLGETRLTQAAFIAEFGVKRKGKSGYATQYIFNWCHDGRPGSFGGLTIAPLANWCLGQESDGSQMVSVLRTTIGGIPAWIASTDLLGDTPVGPISELNRVSTSTTILGLYHSSFRLTIACQSGCAEFP